MPTPEQSALVYKLKGLEDFVDIFKPWTDEDYLHPLRLLTIMAVNKARGVLTCKDDSGRSWQIGLDKGLCYGILREGEPQELAFGKKLSEHVGMDVTMVADILKETKQSGKGTMGFIMSLLGTGNISAQQILQVIRLTRQDILGEIVEISAGEASLDTSASLQISKDPIKIDILQYVNDYTSKFLKKYYYRDLISNIIGFKGMYPMITKSMSKAYQNSLLTDSERKSIESLDGSVTLKDYFAMTNLSKHDAARMISRLLLLNFIKFEKNTGSDASIKKKEDELEGIVTKFSISDHFTRLGVHWTAHISEIENAFQKRFRDWGPDARVRKVSKKTSELCDVLFSYAREAYKVLSDQDRRQEYRKGIIEYRKMIDGADFLYQQAQLSLFRGDVEGARRLIESTLDIRESPLYRKFYQQIGGGTE